MSQPKRSTTKSKGDVNRKVMSPARMPILNVQRTLVKSFDQSNNISGAVFFSNSDNTLSGFQINTLPNNSEFTQLYDQYRLVKVEMKWIPSVTQTPVGASSDLALPRLCTAADFNDGAPASTVTQLQQYQSYQSDLFNREITRTVYPRTATAVYNNGVTSGYSFNDGPMWVDTGNSGVQHYGIKWALVWPAVGTGSVTNKFTLEMRFHIQLRCVA